MTAIRKGVHVVIGSSGLTDEDFVEINEAALEKKVGVMAVTTRYRGAVRVRDRD